MFDKISYSAVIGTNAVPTVAVSGLRAKTSQERLNAAKASL